MNELIEFVQEAKWLLLGLIVCIGILVAAGAWTVLIPALIVSSVAGWMKSR